MIAPMTDEEREEWLDEECQRLERNREKFLIATGKAEAEATRYIIDKEIRHEIN